MKKNKTKKTSYENFILPLASVLKRPMKNKKRRKNKKKNKKKSDEKFSTVSCRFPQKTNEDKKRKRKRRKRKQ